MSMTHCTFHIYMKYLAFDQNRIETSSFQCYDDLVYFVCEYCVR